MRLTLFLMILVGMATAACSSSTSPSEDSGVTTLQITDVKVGTGTTATAGRSVTVHYTGWLYNKSTADHHGKQFDSSRNPGRDAFKFVLGVGAVIAGWDQGVAGMRVGGQRTLVIPPNLAYGDRGAPPDIPGNSTLVFDVELLDVQ